MAFSGFSIPMPNEVTVISLAAWIFYELGNLRNNTATRIFRAVDDIVIQFGFYSSIILSCYTSDTSCEGAKSILVIFMFLTSMFLIWFNWHFRSIDSSEPEKTWTLRTGIWLCIMSFAHAFVFKMEIKHGKDSLWSMLTFLFILISVFVCLTSTNKNVKSITFLLTALLMFHYTAMYQMEFGIFNRVPNLTNIRSERQPLMRNRNNHGAGNYEFNFCSKNSTFCCIILIPILLFITKNYETNQCSNIMRFLDKALKMKNVSTDAAT
ncbi:12088_t:CDS:2, partial [Racocetra persica]